MAMTNAELSFFETAKRFFVKHCGKRNVKVVVVKPSEDANARIKEETMGLDIVNVDVTPITIGVETELIFTIVYC